MQKEGMIFDIQPFSLEDGPGIRTTVFLKGCPLSCRWCHNPEGQNFDAELMYRPEKCISCGKCLICPEAAHELADGKHIFNRSLCEKKFKCAEVCDTGALEISGAKMTVYEIIDIVYSDFDFYKNSGGGLTLSGGEPLSQPEFCSALLEAALEKDIDTCMETSGFCKPEIFSEIIKKLNHLFFDLKETDNELHKKYTGVGREIILDNLETAAKSDIDLTLRCPIIPGLNDREDHFEKIALTALEYKIRKVELKRYHSLGIPKYNALNRKPEYDNRENGELDRDILLKMKKASPETEFSF